MWKRIQLEQKWQPKIKIGSREIDEQKTEMAENKEHATSLMFPHRDAGALQVEPMRLPATHHRSGAHKHYPKTFWYLFIVLLLNNTANVSNTTHREQSQRKKLVRTRITTKNIWFSVSEDLFWCTQTNMRAQSDQQKKNWIHKRNELHIITARQKRRKQQVFSQYL